MVVTITINTPQQAAQALHHVWPNDPQERRKLLRMIIEGKDTGALLAILPLLGPRQTEEAFSRNFSRINIEIAFSALKEIPPEIKYQRPRDLLLKKILRNPIQRWLDDNRRELQDITFLEEEVDEMVGVVKRSRSPEFASKLSSVNRSGYGSLLNQEQRERLKSLAAKYKHIRAVKM